MNSLEKNQKFDFFLTFYIPKFSTLNNKIFQKILSRISFWFPVLLFAIIFNDEFYTIYANIILALSIIIVSNLVKYRRLDIIFETIGAILFNIILFIQIAHLYIFDVRFQSSTFFIIFESNTGETFDFLSMYFDTNLTVVFGLLVLTLLVGIYFLFRNAGHRMKTRTKIIYSLVVLISLSVTKIRRATFPDILFLAAKQYIEDKEGFNKVTLDRLGGKFSDVKHFSKTQKETYVLIIGESTTRSHMQLYGYYRETTPNLNKMKEDLVIFNDVIAPHVSTIASLDKVLTLASRNSKNKKYDGTLIQLFNKAGFKTYWLSNQRPLGLHETNVTIISNNCDKQIFLNTVDESKDAILLPRFQKILDLPYDKKFIVIHLMGTHVEYKNSYHGSFKKFKTTPITKFKHKKAYRTINQYDNSNLYNDYIVSEIFKQLKATDTKSYALFFSDHGDDVYETLDLAGHTYKGTKPMHDIPFILWRSDKFKKEENEFVYDTARKYSTEDLLYTLSDLSGIRFKEFEPSNSLVNKKFTPKKRFISNKKDYDIRFK